VVLAHEMQHAFHETQGTMGRGTFTDPTGVSPDSGGIANFERQAVGLSRSDTPGGAGHYPGDQDGCSTMPGMNP
jgi:hypothetical protein